MKRREFMLDNKLHTPVGVKDVLPREARIKKEVIKGIEGLFESYGYSSVESPMFEYIEVFSDEKMGSTNPKQMYRFFDRKGSELSLRSDMTPPIARIAATAYAESKMPLRFCYVGNIFRLNENYQGKMCEVTQGGVELMGAKSIEADAEVLALAAKSFLAANIKEFRIHVGQVNFFKSMLEETGLPEKEQEQLKDMVAQRNYVGVEDLLEEREMKGKTKELFLELPKMVGTMEILERAKSLTDNKEALGALDEMRRLYEYMELFGLSQYFVFDLGMVSGLNYYTGIIFRGYTYGTGYSIVDGGRYDNLVSQFGRSIPAVGFGIKISEILSVIEHENIQIDTHEPKALMGYSREGIATAVTLADEYRKDGVKIEMALGALTFDETVAYAEEKGLESILYLVNATQVKYARIVEGVGVMASDMTIEDLKKLKEEASDR